MSTEPSTNENKLNKEKVKISTFFRYVEHRTRLFMQHYLVNHNNNPAEYPSSLTNKEWWHHFKTWINENPNL